MIVETYDLLFSVLVGAEKVDSLHVSKVDVMSQEEDKEQLAHVLLFTVAIQSFVSCLYSQKDQCNIPTYKELVL